jgi:hypothetical protein
MLLLLLLTTTTTTTCRTLSGSCLAGAWLTAGEGGKEDSAAAPADSAKNLTEEVEIARDAVVLCSCCSRHETFVGRNFVDSSAHQKPDFCFTSTFASFCAVEVPVTPCVQVKNTVRQQGFADYKGKSTRPRSV